MVDMMTLKLVLEKESERIGFSWQRVRCRGSLLWTPQLTLLLHKGGEFLVSFLQGPCPTQFFARFI
jgi:hypothetical protein